MKRACRGLTVDTAVLALVKLHQHVEDDAAAKDEVTTFIKRNARQVVKGDSWKLFKERFPGLVDDMFVAISE